VAGEILSFKPHLTVINRTAGIQEVDALCHAIAAIDGVTGVAAGIESRVLVQHAGHMLAPVVVGTSPDRAADVSRVPEHMVAGTFDLHADRVVIGSDAAAALGAEVGSRLLVYSPLNVLRDDELYLPEEVTVAGIFNLGMRDYDAGFLLTSLDVAGELVGIERGAQALYVMTDDAFRFAEYAERVAAVLPPGHEVKTWREIDSVLFSALSHEKTMMFILLVFITIVAIFCVTNTLIVITVQKTTEIGLLKALGFAPREIMGAFVLHGWLQCLVGTAAGEGVGLLVLHNLRGIVRLLTSFNVHVFPKEIYGLSEIPWSTSVGELVNIALFVIVFCTLSSVVPAWRAARLDPVVALRGE